MGAVGKSNVTYTESDITNLGIKLFPSFNKLNDDVKNSIYKQVGAMFTEFPFLSNYVNGIKVVNNVNTDMGYYSSGSQAGLIVISGDYAGKPLNAFDSPGVSFISDNEIQKLTHELAHAVATHFGSGTEKSLNGARKVLSSLQDKTNTKTRLESSQKITNALNGISNYSRDNDDGEKFAEAVTDYMIHKSKAHSISKDVVRAIHKMS